VSALPVTRGPITCDYPATRDPYRVTPFAKTCCQTETDDEGIEIKWCVHCDTSKPEGSQCGNRYQALETSPSPPSGPKVPLENILPGGEAFQELTTPSSPPGPFVPPQGGILQQTPPSQGVAPPPLTRGQGILPQEDALQQPPANQGAAEEPPATEDTQPAAVEEEAEPLCPEGQVLDENSGFCLPEDCPEGQVLDEETGLCVLEEPEAAEEEPAQTEPEGEQPSEESGSGDNSNN
jgi:hypothetical protein